VIETVLGGLIVAAISGLAIIAYKNPKGYKQLSSSLKMLALYIFVGISIWYAGYVMGFDAGQEAQDQLGLPSFSTPIWTLGLYVGFNVVVIFLEYLAAMAGVVEEDNEPPNEDSP